jgi:hypothetical protein
VNTGVSADTGDASAAGAVFRGPLGWAWSQGLGLGPGDGVISGNRRAALPAPMRLLAAPFRFGIGPSGSMATWTSGEDVGDFFALAVAEVAVTAVVSAAAGGVHFVLVATLAVAVSCTELTEVAVAAMGICARKLAGCFVVTEAMVQVAAPLPLAQPPLNVGFWLAGCAVSATDTFEADPFCVVTCTT